jgi:pimeloyl-ACP methyl ester carboxylesterase
MPDAPAAHPAVDQTAGEQAAADLRAAVSLAGRGVAATTRTIRDLHLAIARRPFRASGAVAKPAHLLHDAISTSVYATVAAGARVAATTAGFAAAARAAVDPSYRPLSERPRGNVALGAINGAWGDWLDRTRSPLALRMALRYAGREIAPLTPAGIAAAYQQTAPTGDVAIWLHGLCETDASWQLGAERHYQDPHSTHGERLRQETQLTSAYLRYNTGLHISANGRSLDLLLTELTDAWPVPITRLTLIGHSMGGLVVRSAAAQGCANGSPWVERVRRVVYLGSPHLGAPLEVGAARAARALRRLPETKPLADALASRSVGIKDLRYGDVLDDDWADVTDFDGPRPEPTNCAPLLDGAEHYFIGATIGARHDTPVARILGDALVPFASASGAGRGRTLGLDVDRGRHLGGLHHFDLLNHPRVYAVLREWLREG